MEGEATSSAWSAVNSGILGTQRIHVLLNNINYYCRTPLSIDESTTEICYKLLLRDLHSLQKEFALANNRERKIGNEMYFKIKELIKLRPVPFNNKTKRYDDDAWDLLEPWFERYQDWVMQIGVKYHYLTAIEEADNEGAGFDY